MRLFGSERIAKLMDRMGIEEGEVIQHSMITSSIERAQKKVEENNFGIRKRLLEYDDVMNAQREVVYKKRRHALYGERLTLDLQNMMYDLVDSIAATYSEDRDYDAFNLELIRLFSIESPVSKEEFMQAKPDALSSKIFAAVEDHYKAKSKLIADRTFPVLKNIYENQSNAFENIVVPFTDGIHNIQVLANLKKAYETNGRELINAFERSVTLSLIDDAWKEHLREMDDLKQSVQSAVYEQKDPLLIYKFESFELFKKMLEQINRDTMSFLFKGTVQGQDEQKVQEARAPQRTDLSKLKTSHDSFENTSHTGGEGNGNPNEQRKAQPVRVEQKVGRNDPCPCGSGKKYKNCHGAMVES